MNARPNIVFLHVDQLHYRALSCMGNPWVSTPNIDRIVQDGVLFTNSYCATPQCSPSRAAWYTGRMSTESGLPTNGLALRPDIPDLGQWLRQQRQYETYYAGKWHIPQRSQTDGFTALGEPGKFADGTKGEFTDGALAQCAVGFLSNYSKPAPFFLNIGFTNPHDCCSFVETAGGCGKFCLTNKLIKSLPPLPDNYIDNTIYKPEDWSLENFRFYLYCYYRLVEMVDNEIGRIYTTLQSSSFKDNTLLILSSDHGEGLGYHGKLGKGFLEEDAWRSPIVMVYPSAFPGNRRIDELAISVDITATICDYADTGPIFANTFGRSLRPLAEQAAVPWRNYLVGESILSTQKTKPQITVRDDRFKTIFYLSGLKRCFDLISDPLETRDISDNNPSLVIDHLAKAKEYIISRELCEVPTWGGLSKQQKDTYKCYLTWYSDITEGRYQ